jgi:hypothetical protein
MAKADAIHSRPVRSSVPTTVGTLVTHWKGGILSLNQDSDDPDSVYRDTN